MSRNFRCEIGVCMMYLLIMAVMVVAGDLAFNFLLVGGINNFKDGMAHPGDGFLILIGMCQLFWFGFSALLAIFVINRCLKVVDRLRAWRVGHG